MEEHYKLTNTEFEQQVENCSLWPVPFTHVAHLRLAWIHITKYGEQAAIQNICNQLKVYTIFIGAEDKFNITVTIAAIKAVKHFINKSASNTFLDLINEFPALVDDFKGLIGTHYSVDVFSNEKAKISFLHPDLAPFE